MNFALSDEQLLLQEAARTALGRVDTVAAGRAALEDSSMLPNLWPLAIEAGWPGLLVAEEDGGAGLGAFEAMLVAEVCGRTLAAVPLLGALPAALLLGTGGSDALPRVASGARRPAYVPARPPAHAGAGWTADPVRGRARAAAPRVDGDGPQVTVTGSAAFVPDAAGAALLVVVGGDAAGEPVAVAVDAEAPGVSVTPVVRYDATRLLAHVALDGAPGRRLEATGADCARAWHLAQAMLASEALGAAGALLQMATQYAQQRFTFGRAIGSYQAIKHPLTEILRQVENTRSLQYWAGWAWESRPAEFGLAVGALRTLADRALDFANTTNIVTHGGIGVTWEHDAPLYFRRATLASRLLGGSQASTDAFAGELLARREVPAHA